MAKEAKGVLVAVEKRFDYSPLEAKTAEKVHTAAERIRQAVKRTIEDIIGVGIELLAVREALPHGQFGPWLRAEFGWTERTARNFIGVAERFGPKTEIISDLRIEPTAAYLLAAPSASDEAREAALERAEAGERITAKVAKEILARERRNGRDEGNGPPWNEWARNWTHSLPASETAGTRRNLPISQSGFGSSRILWRKTNQPPGKEVDSK